MRGTVSCTSDGHLNLTDPAVSFVGGCKGREVVQVMGTSTSLTLQSRLLADVRGGKLFK